MSYAEFVARDRRLVILRLLDEASGYNLSSRLLQKGLHQVGHSVSISQVETDLEWLKENAPPLVATEKGPLGDVTLATLTERGRDVAAGHEVVVGVDRPSPR